MQGQGQGKPDGGTTQRLGRELCDREARASLLPSACPGGVWKDLVTAVNAPSVYLNQIATTEGSTQENWKGEFPVLGSRSLGCVSPNPISKQNQTKTSYVGLWWGYISIKQGS